MRLRRGLRALVDILVHLDCKCKIVDIDRGIAAYFIWLGEVKFHKVAIYGWYICMYRYKYAYFCSANRGL